MMQTDRYRLLIVPSHPVQYSAPSFQLLAQDARLEILVAYCSLLGAEPSFDIGFGREIKWDVPLLEGYPWIAVANRSPRPNLQSFFGLINPELWHLIRNGNFDAVLYYAGYKRASFWIAATAAKSVGVPFVFGTDAWELQGHTKPIWKSRMRKLIWPWIYGLGDLNIAVSSGGVELLRSIGISQDRIVLTQNVVNNDWWETMVSGLDKSTARQIWGIPNDAAVVLNCAKLQAWKRPLDLLQAFARATLPNAYLLFAGDGPLRQALELESIRLGIAERVRFLGFVNQSKLPSLYRSADLFVLPSEHEPFGMVVNEAMVCGCPVVVSDRVGARYDLVREGETGFIYPCGNVEALAMILRDALTDRERLELMAQVARKRMETWSPREYVGAIVGMVEKAVQSKSHSSA